jgi:hypothetical protein
VAALLACWSAAERWAKAVTAVVPTSGDRVVPTSGDSGDRVEVGGDSD